MLEGLGIETGVLLPKVVEASRYLAEAIGHRPPGRYLAAVWEADQSPAGSGEGLDIRGDRSRS